VQCVRPIDKRPSSGSCARCGSALDLASLRADEKWYCSSLCALGRPRVRARGSVVPEAWLRNRPRRHFRKRAPRELQR